MFVIKFYKRIDYFKEICVFKKLLSKSTIIMFLFDLIILVLSSVYWFNYFSLPAEHLDITVLLTALTGIIVLFLKDNYKIREFNSTLKNSYLLFEGVVFSQIPATILLLTFNKDVKSFEFILFNLFTIYITLLIYRRCFHYYLFNIKKIKNVLIIGSNSNAKLIADEIIAKKALRMNVTGFVEYAEDDAIINDSNITVFPKVYELDEIIKDKKIDIVIIAIKRRMEEAFLTKMVNSIPKDVTVYKMPEFYEMVTGKYFVDRMSINWLFYDYMKNRSRVYDFCKRAYDIIAALIILTVTAPILIYIGIRVKKIDGGPAIYTQNRVGKDGKIFKAYKLRTMYLNDYVPTGENLNQADNQNEDSRVIPFCKFVRKARFDEIPQMINILKGEMSIVGPRTEWDEVVKVYSEKIPYHNCRHWVKTGWTGWAQINQGHLFSSDAEAEKLQYDLYYLKHRNVLWEIGILIKAVFLALGGRHG